jgi:predicted Na+-dependent transporter
VNPDRIRARLERLLLPLVIVAAALGVAVTGPGRAGVRHDGIDIVLAVLVFCSALAVPDGAASSLRRLGPRLGLVLVAATVALPPIALGLGRLLGSADLRHGVLSVGVAPAEVASVGITGIAGGDVAVAAALLVASVVVSVMVAGPILSLLAGVSVSSGHVLVTLVVVVGLPLAVGLVVRRLVDLSPTAADSSAVTSMVAVLVLVELVASQVHLSSSYAAVAGVLVAVIAVSAGVGWALGRLFPSGAALAVLLHVSMRDFAVASGIASAAFGAPATGPLGIYGVLVIGWGAIVASRRRGGDGTAGSVPH